MPNLDPTPPLPVTKVTSDTLSATEFNQVVDALANLAAAVGAVDDGTIKTISDLVNVLRTPLIENSAGGQGLSIPGVNNLGRSSISILDRIRYLPFAVFSPITITEVVLRQTATSTATAVVLGIYEADDNWLPTNLVTTLGVVDISTTGVKRITSLSVNLSIGRYVGVWHADGTGTFVVSYGNPVNNMLIEDDGSTMFPILRIYGPSGRAYDGTLDDPADPNVVFEGATGLTGLAYPFYFKWDTT